MADRIDRRTFLQSMLAVTSIPLLERMPVPQQVVYPPVTMAGIEIPSAIQQPINCPIYMFHMPSANQVESIISNNRRASRIPITISRLTSIMLDEEEIPEEELFCLTFDDGYRSQYQQALPILERWIAPATFFVMGTGWQGDRVHSYMSPEQIQDISNKGFEIGSHTINHPRSLIALRSVNRGAYLAEIFGSKIQLEELIQKEITSFAYPTGVYDTPMMQDVSTAYKAAVSTKNRVVQTEDLMFALGRIRG